RGRRVGIAVPWCQVARLPAGGRHDEQVLALVFDPFIPVAVEQLAEHASLDGIVGRGFLFLLVLLVTLGVRCVREFGVDGGDEGDPFAIRRPLAGAGLAGDRRKLPSLAAFDRNDPELEITRAIRLEQDLLAVGAPARMLVLFTGSR